MALYNLTCIDSKLGWYNFTSTSTEFPFMHASVCLGVKWGPCFAECVCKRCSIIGTVCVPPPRAQLLTSHYYVVESPLQHYYVIEDFNQYNCTVKRHKPITIMFRRHNTLIMAQHVTYCGEVTTSLIRRVPPGAARSSLVMSNHTWEALACARHQRVVPSADFCLRKASFSSACPCAPRSISNWQRQAYQKLCLIFRALLQLMMWWLLWAVPRGSVYLKVRLASCIHCYLDPTCT